MAKIVKMKASAKIDPKVATMPSAAPSEESKQYETKNHLNTLTEAMDIMGDPDKMKRVHALVGRHKKAIRSLSDLKATRDAYKGEPDEDDLE